MLDAREIEVADFCKALTTGVFGVVFEPEPTSGPLEKKDVKLFCFKESLEAASLADMVVSQGGEQGTYVLFTNMRFETRW